MKEKCQKPDQSYQNVAVNKQLEKWKHHCGIRKYIANKLVTFGVKLWMLTDGKNGYFFSFDMYFGKIEQTYKNGLEYVVSGVSLGQSKLPFFL